MRATVRRKPCATPTRAAEREHHAALRRQAVEAEALDERRDEADLGSDDARRQLAVENDEGARVGIEHVVPCVADGRRGKLRNTHLREEAVDERLLRLGEPLVEQSRVLERIAPGEAVSRSDSRTPASARTSRVMKLKLERMA